MARRILLSLLIILSAGGACYLRGSELSLSFAGPSLWSWALWGLLGAVALLTLLLSLPEKAGHALADYRAVPFGAVLQGAGALLVTAGGAWQLYQLYPALQSLQTVSALALLLGGLGLFGGMIAFLGSRRAAGGLLLPMCAAGTYLVLTYLEIASDPRLLHFDMRMLTIGMASLSLVSLCSLIFSKTGRRWFLLFSALTVPLSVTALYTAEHFSQALALMGCALAAFGFFLSVLFGIPLRHKQNYELVADPFRTGSLQRDEIRKMDPASDADKPAAAPTPAQTPVSAEKVEAEPAPVPAPVQAPAPAEKNADKPVPDENATPAVSHIPDGDAPSPAANPDSQPKEEADFDLARVDRLLKDLGVDISES